MKWIKCSDRLPEKGKYVLTYNEAIVNPEYRLSIMSLEDLETITWYTYHGNTSWITPQVTHWMPLPAFPKENE